MQKLVVAAVALGAFGGVCGGAAGQFEFIEGRWEGSWFNNTFQSTGSWVSEFSTAGSTITATTDLGGFVFGGPDPDPVTGSFTVNPDGSIDFGVQPGPEMLSGTFIGSTISTQLIDVNGGAMMGGFDLVTFEGSFDGDSFQGTYEIFFFESDAEPFADGTVNLRRIPAPGTAGLVGVGAIVAMRRRR